MFEEKLKKFQIAHKKLSEIETDDMQAALAEISKYTDLLAELYQQGGPELGAGENAIFDQENKELSEKYDTAMDCFQKLDQCIDDGLGLIHIRKGPFTKEEILAVLALNPDPVWAGTGTSGTSPLHELRKAPKINSYEHF